MATFLVTSKMNPELAARIESAVRGGVRRVSVRRSPGRVAATRFLVILTLMLSLAFLGLSLRAQRIEFDAAKARLEQQVSAEMNKVSPSGWKLLPAATAALSAAAQPLKEDFVADVLKDRARFAALLARPILYLRADLGDVNSEGSIERAAADANKDAFVACLLDPPSARDEEPILKKVRAVYRGEAFQEQRGSNVRRLFDLFYAMNFLRPEWASRVQRARDVIEVGELQHKFDEAQVERMIPATQAQLLIYVLDEPKKLGTAVELDGASDHWVRLGIVEFQAQGDALQSHTLLSVHRHLDPKWISEGARSRYAVGMDACRLAADLWTDVTKEAQ
ncbi:MAG TPA: hypothetical protein VL137_11625 [Polyangiaceae bacterium]|nr:hypothetical protein [Polyangiaceae bacterium]